MIIQAPYATGDFLPLTFSLKCLFSAVAVRSDATVSLTSFLFSLRSKAKALKTSCCGGRLLEFILDTFWCSFPSFTDCNIWTTEARSARGRLLLLFFISHASNFSFPHWESSLYTEDRSKIPIWIFQNCGVSSRGTGLQVGLVSQMFSLRRIWVDGLNGMLCHLNSHRKKGKSIS